MKEEHGPAMYKGIYLISLQAAELQPALKSHRQLCFHNASHLQEAIKKKEGKEEEHMKTGIKRKQKRNKKNAYKKRRREKEKHFNYIFFFLFFL
jgi:predicted ATP-dependent protease